MMTRARKTAPKSERSFQPQQSQFASRPFASKADEHEAPVGESRVSFSLADIDIFPRETVQPTLKLGPVSDRFEQEADQVASKVLQTISSPNQNQVQRTMDPLLRLKVAGLSSAGIVPIGPDVESGIQKARSGGKPLPDGVRLPMERAFGADFGGVRVHADAQADSLNRSLQARAFTTGQDIFLRQGEYRPGSSEGQRLLAHELTHVMQQNGDDGRGGQMQAMGPVIQRKKYAPGGNIIYYTESFTRGTEEKSRERVKSVVMAGMNIFDDTPPNEPVSFYRTEDGTWDDLEGYHRGHVAARQYGGTYASYNIVPMLPNFNTGAWKNEEDVIGKKLDSSEIVTVQPNYNATFDARVPNSLTVSSTGGYKHEVPHAVTEREATTDSYELILQQTLAEPGTKEHADSILDKCVTQGFVPPYYKMSPYYILDVMWLNGGGGIGSPGSRFDVQTWQVDWLIRYNKRLNGGNMVSDAWVGVGGKEKYKKLIEAGRNDRPEVDHIIPMSKGGANLFSNFRLVSFELNNSIERVVPYEQKSVKWKP
jgi:hypothetical protein